MPPQKYQIREGAMTEPRFSWSELSDEDLELALQDLGEAVVYPATPELARRVSERLARDPAPRSSLLGPFLVDKRWLAALVLLAIGIGLLLVPQVRTAIADRLGLSGVVIRWEETPPPATPVGARLMLGRPVTLAEANAAVDFPVLVPTASGFANPPEIYLAGEAESAMISFVYPARPGLPPATGDIGALLTQFRGQVNRNLIEKGLHGDDTGDETRLDLVVVDGSPGFWISGAPHTFFFVCPVAGECREERYRLAGNVLLWERDGLTLRLESALTRDEAIVVATSLQPAG
jgi:hypothetical protein